MKAIDILGTRLERQSLLSPLENEERYPEFFRLFQPVPTIYFTRPGDPPSLFPRTAFDDLALNDHRRAEGQILKGRFAGGGVGYVCEEEFDLYANAFVNPMRQISEVHSAILEALRSCGPLAPRQLKEETGYLSKQIGPALNRLQTAFLVFEDQSEGEWERPFASMEEVRDLTIDPSIHLQSVCAVIERFLEVHVGATREEIIGWSRLSRRIVDEAIRRMSESEIIYLEFVEEMGEVYVLGKDRELSFRGSIESIFMLDLADPIIRPQKKAATARFGDLEVLQYLLINGEIRGAIVGHWRIGPHDVDDITLDLEPDMCLRLRDGIIDVVARAYHPPRSNIRRYCGEPIQE